MNPQVLQLLIIVGLLCYGAGVLISSAVIDSRDKGSFLFWALGFPVPAALVALGTGRLFL